MNLIENNFVNSYSNTVYSYGQYITHTSQFTELQSMDKITALLTKNEKEEEIGPLIYPLVRM